MNTKTELTQQERELLIDALIQHRNYLIQEYQKVDTINQIIEDLRHPKEDNFKYVQDS